ncbi:MAG TPA: type VI secretion system membrane subunit TssM [Caulobacteraceae bacterium]|nr:type VI secretion system membrane subunit TssM [Caulobacteraceae bacterium]
MKRLFNWWTVSIATAVLIALCLCLALPIFVHFLRPWWVRLLMLVVIAAVWGLLAWLRLRKARRADQAIERQIAAPEPGAGEASAMTKRMAEALAGLRKASGGRRDYLYNRPWYMIIGPPGAGKTTALINSGLRFPYSETALKGAGGTRNLDFWFADEAALVDTAGRYTTQDSDAPADARAWQGFLDTLRKQRPLQPINGVLVALGVDELARADRLSLDAHAAAVRRRLAELRTTLQVSAPVYVLFTKADLLAGFTEFFSDLDVEGRRAVAGATFTLGEGADRGRIAAEYDAFAQGIADRTSGRLQAEADIRRRSLILGFPAQLDAIRARVLRFLEGAFPDGGEDVGVLRGFYFTSGVQEGAPLDRLLSGVAQVFDQPQASTQGHGRAYFLNRLLTEVVFPESGLVQDDPRAKARRRSALLGGLAAIAAVSVLTLVLWAVSFTGNRGLQNRLQASAVNAQGDIRQVGVDMVEVKTTDPDLEQSLGVLRSLRELPGGYADQKKGGHPFLQGFGLYQSGDAAEAKQVYLTAVQRIMLPRLILRLERYLADHKADPLATYEALKVYLELGGQGPFDAGTVRTWVKNDWAADAYPGADRQQVREELGQHLDALLEDGAPSAVWPNRVAPLDAELIASARQTIQNLSLADRAYAILKQKAAAEGAPWRASTVLSSGDGRAFALGDATLQLSAPYFYTKAGYQRAYLPGLRTVQVDLRKDAWVMGADVGTTAVQSQMSQVSSGVAAAYARDYIATWEGVVKALRPADYFHDPVAFGVFTRTPSPLKLILLELRKNVMLSGAAAAGPAIPGAKMLGAAEAMMGGGATIDAGQQIESAFRPVTDYVGDGKAPAPVDDFINSVKSAGAANAGAQAAGGGLGGAAAQGQLATAIGGLATASAGAPPLLQDFVKAAASGGKSAGASSAQGAISDAYAKDLLGQCQAVTADRYPFNGQSQSDAAVADMLRLFGQGGAFDSFIRDRLGALVDRVGPVWRWNTQDPVGAALDPMAAEDFQKADRIHDMLAGGLSMQVSSAGFGGSVTAAEIGVGGVTYRFDATSTGAKPLAWSPTSGTPEAHVTLYSGAKAIKTFEAAGPWAIFRLMDKARQENAGPTAFKATFGEGAAFATFKIDLGSDRNPFRRGSIWSFRCPAKL